MNNRQQKLGREIQRVVSNFCQESMSDYPIVITEVVMINKATAHIYYQPLTDQLNLDELEQLHQSLVPQTPKVRKALSDQMALRYTPNIHFKLSTSALF